METLARVLGYLIVGGLLLLVNGWYIRSVIGAFAPREVVITPFRLVGESDAEGSKGSAIASLVQARYQQWERDLQAAQRALMVTAPSHLSGQQQVPKSLPGVPQFWTSAQPLAITVFEPKNIQVNVSGVEVGKFLPWLQRAIIGSNTVDLVIYREPNHSTIVAGNVNVLHATGNESPSLRLVLDDGSAEAISDAVALELVRRSHSEGASPDMRSLDGKQFRALLEVTIEAARLKQLVDLGRPVKALYVELFKRIDDLARSVPNWYQVNCLAATISQSADQEARAIEYYAQAIKVIEATQPVSAELQGALAGLKTQLNALETRIAGESPASNAVGVEKITADANYAIQVLNELFEVPKDQQLKTPQIVTEGKDIKTAYYDPQNGSYHCPLAIAEIPDITYWNMVHPFTMRGGSMPYEGQAGAITMAYAYAFGSLVKQRHLGQNAHTADWVLAPRGVAWLKDEDIHLTTNTAPVFSLRAPGTAYDDRVLGKDPQIANYANLYRGSDDNGGVHTNAGIGTKAFYTLATATDSDTAARIWSRALPKLKLQKPVTYPALAKLTLLGATELFSNNPSIAEAVRASWKMVGIDLE